MNPRFPLLESSSETTGPTGWGLEAFCKEKQHSDSQLSYTQFIIKVKLLSDVSVRAACFKDIIKHVNKTGGDVMSA